MGPLESRMETGKEEEYKGTERKTALKIRPRTP